MKKIILLTISLILFFSSCNFSYRKIQDNSTCSSDVFNYNGPHNENQLAKLLNESTDPILKNLSKETKSIIRKNMIFYNGRPIGYNESAENLKKLYASNNYKEVLSAILGCEIIAVTYDTKPLVKEISIKDFNNLPLTKGGKSYTRVVSHCLNCVFGSHKDMCCVVGGTSCYDLIVLVGDTYYNVYDAH